MATASLLELQDLYNEALVREIIGKTKSGCITWSHTGGNQFQSTESCDNTWDFFITKTQVGNITDKFSLDIKKDGQSHVYIESGTLPRTERDNAVKELFEVTECIVMKLDMKLKETLHIVQNISGNHG